MGLELVELALSIEEAFDIEISDEDMEAFYGTAGELHAYVLRNVPSLPVCLTAAAFFRLRPAFVKQFGVARKAIGPSSSVPDLLSRSALSEAWGRLEEATGLVLPRLRWPEWARQLVFALSLASVGVALALLPFTVFWTGWLTCAGGLLSALAVAGAIQTSSCRRVPERCLTVGGLARAVGCLNIPRLPGHSPPGRLPDSWQVVADLVADISGVDRAQITRDTHLTRDLGLDQ